MRQPRRWAAALALAWCAAMLAVGGAADGAGAQTVAPGTTVVEPPPPPLPMPRHLYWHGNDLANPRVWEANPFVANWVSNGTLVGFETADTVEFGDYSGIPDPPNPTVEIDPDGVRPLSVVFDHGVGQVRSYRLTSSGTTGITGITSLVKRGPGELRIENANTYVGDTVLQDGTLTLAYHAGRGYALGAGGRLVVRGGDLRTDGVQAVNNNVTFATARGARVGVRGTDRRPNILLFLKSVRLDGDAFLSLQDTEAHLQGTVTGPGGLLVEGGEVLVTGNNTYAGGTAISSGGRLTLQALGGAATGAGTGPVVVADGGTLSGNGTIPGQVAVLAGGRLQVDAPGVTIRNDLTMERLSVLSVQLENRQKALTVTGRVTVSGVLDARLPANPDPVLHVLDNQGTAPVNGRFTNALGNDLAEGALVPVAGKPYLISYRGERGDDNDIVLKAVPPES
jgi:autotransporter-associated beta strand protein